MRGGVASRVDAAAAVRLAAAGAQRLDGEPRSPGLRVGRGHGGADRGRASRGDDPGADRQRCRDAAGGAAGRQGRGMIVASGGVRVMVATRPVDFRKGMEGLAALVREVLGADPFSGAVFVYRKRCLVPTFFDEM